MRGGDIKMLLLESYLVPASNNAGSAPHLAHDPKGRPDLRYDKLDLTT